ncbi:hypothetical protein CBR_g52170 [Chara braunii]|uniref:DUF4360 domain-containing protein n=1 Tax=Chara braunii TaxID=69332 RepID=A0A388M9U1_CHABU|nr:hypothetical protein CBR_g52170 [Chara braunii]|eukprot:GBG91285.1 hypothetical protein CBR_g52170 [Chara braunii]
MMRAVCPISETARLLLTLVLLVILQLAGQGSAVSPPPGSVTIDSLTFGGSGCPYDGVDYVLSEDLKAMTMKFTKFIATTHKSAAHRTRRCQISVNLSYPEGFAVGLGSVTFSGYAKLDRGVSGSIKAFYYFSGQAGTARITRKIQGPLDDNLEYRDGFGSALYSTCGSNKQTLSVGLEVTVKPGKKPKGAGGIIRVEALLNAWDLVWEQC